MVDQDDDGADTQENRQPLYSNASNYNCKQQADCMRDAMQQPSLVCHSWQIGKTAATFIYHLAMGAYVSSLGVALVHLSLLFHVQTSDFFIVFISQGTGNILGAITSGIIFDRLRYEPQLAVMSIVAAMATIAAPWSESLYGFAAFRFITSFTIGYVEPASNPYVLLLWTGSRLSAPIILAKNCMYSVGAAISPVIIRLFLVPLAKSNSSLISDVQNFSTASRSCQSGFEQSGELANDTESFVNDFATIEGVDIVRWAFMLGSGAFAVAAVIYALTCACRQFTVRQIQSRSVANDEQSSQRPLLSARLLQVSITITLSVFLLFHLWTLMTVMQLLSTMVQCGLGWDVAKATRIVTVFYAALLTGRVMSIPLSAYILPDLIILVSLVLQLAGSLLILFAYNGIITVACLWVGSALAGLGTSSVIGCVFLWIAKHMKISGFLSALLMLGCYVGAFVGPTLTSLVTDVVGYGSINYSTLLSCIMQWLTFFTAICLVRLMKNKLKATTVAVESVPPKVTAFERECSPISINDEDRPLTSS